MKSCKWCHMKMDDDETSAYSCAWDLGDIFISEIGDVNVEDRYPERREDLGILSLPGFEP
ncbi:MAG: hypothetical protein ABSC57_05115 [Syntrophales bacterium]